MPSEENLSDGIFAYGRFCGTFVYYSAITADDAVYGCYLKKAYYFKNHLIKKLYFKKSNYF